MGSCRGTLQLKSLNNFPAMAEQMSTDGACASRPRASSSFPTEGAMSVPEKKASRCYRMDHPRRGRAHIFNQRSFEEEKRLGLERRDGTDQDVDNLRSTLDSLNFDVIVHQDKRCREIEDILENLANEDHSDADCLFVALFTHGGEKEMVWAYDAEFSTEIFWSTMSSTNCPSLAGKPKIYLVQACRGQKTNEPVRVAKAGRNSSSQDTNGNFTITLPNHSDCLLIYSTIPGFYSLRNTVSGSWLVQAFCRVMDTEKYDDDLVSILTEVSHVVASEFEAIIPDENQRDIHHKQMCCFTSMLRKKVQFAKK